MKRYKKCIVGLSIVLAIVFILYWILINILVSALLVTSFMQKLDAFEEITDQSLAQQVQSQDILDEEERVLSETTTWFKNTTHEKIYMESQDGYNFVAMEFIQPQESNQWAVLLHGYTGVKEEMYQFAMWYYQQGYNVLVPDLRDQGESEGDYIGMGWTDHFDCMDWVNQIVERDSDAQIVLQGQSMGASTALIMSGDEAISQNVKAIISDCGYTDAYSMFGDKITEWFHLPAFPFVDSACLALRLRGGYDLKKASAINGVHNSDIPILFIHGDQDAMIDVNMAYELYEAAACDKQLLIISGAGHAQAQYKETDTYYDTIQSFIGQYIH